MFEFTCDNDYHFTTLSYISSTFTIVSNVILEYDVSDLIIDTSSATYTYSYIPATVDFNYQEDDNTSNTDNAGVGDDTDTNNQYTLPAGLQDDIDYAEGIKDKINSMYN